MTAETFLKVSAKSTTPEYATWLRIIDRCHRPESAAFHKYGAKGTTVCDEWRGSFDAFLRDMGKRPSHLHSIDRIDVHGHYEPGNCRWATAREQANNRTNNRIVEYRGATVTLAEAVRSAGNVVEFHTARRRLNRGWQAERAVETPPLFSVPWTKYK